MILKREKGEGEAKKIEFRAGNKEKEGSLLEFFSPP